MVNFYLVFSIALFVVSLLYLIYKIYQKMTSEKNVDENDLLSNLLKFTKTEETGREYSLI